MSSSRKAYCYIPISTHAEVDALRKLKYYCKRYSANKRLHFDLLVIRVTKTGKLSMARPCYHCIQQLMQASFVNIQQVYYTDTDGVLQREKFADMLHSKKTYVSSGYRHRCKDAC